MRNALLSVSLLFLSVPFASAAQVDDETAVQIAQPRETIFERGADRKLFAESATAADNFYGFWNNGSQALLDAAISRGFVDHTLPAGRPQGPTGPVIASKAFLAAVPDLRAEVVQRLFVGDRVVSHLRFTGHFTGEFMGRQGNGEAVDFIATDILRIRDGRITDNWHLEDNLTFLQQIGVISGE
ncbi:ester cyclase [Rhizobium wenxiniae]|uniref:ester cyclase n=1 Tax=Rhizobium wenxiniae TaxID=1737357 RepID=UPI003C14D42B